MKLVDWTIVNSPEATPTAMVTLELDDGRIVSDAAVGKNEQDAFFQAVIRALEPEKFAIINREEVEPIES